MEKDGANLAIDNTDQGADPGDTGETGEGEEEQEQQEAGILPDQSAGPGGLPDEISEDKTAASQAVDRFDQMKAGPGDKEQEAPQPGMPDEDAIPGSGVSMSVMDQWLEQIEGDPVYLLLNQFRLEEQQEYQRNGRRLMETRPW